MTPEFEKQILVAGVGNAWLQDDAFGGECARRLEARGVPDGVTVMDFGTGGLDLAYELMRGYDALVLLDASRQGGEPGTLYVIEPQLSDYEASIEDGDVINPHGMDPAEVLRFVNVVGGFSGQGRRHRVRARRGRRRRPRPDAAGRGAPSSGRSSSSARRSTSCARTPPTRPDARVLDRLRRRRHRGQARGGAAGDRR